MEIVVKTIREIESLIKTGKTPPSKEERYYNGNINWYTPGDLDKEKYLGKSNRTITEAAVAENKATILPKHTVVIGAIGDIGKLGITSTESCTNQQITGIRTNDEVYFEYFYYWLKANKRLLRSNAKNAILPILNNESIRSIKVQFPKEIDDQKRIAKVLSQCDALIQKRKKSIDLLDDFLRSTFLEMFGDPVRNEKDWRLESLLDFGKFKNGLNYTSNEIGGEFKYLGVGDFKDKWLLDDIDSLKSISLEVVPSDDYFLKNGDLVFVRSNGNKQLVGRCIVVFPNNTKVTFSGFCIRFRPESTDVNPVYLAHLFRNQNFKLRMLNSGRGANIQNINQELLSSLKIPIPPNDLQINFAHMVTYTEAIKKLFHESLKELENLYGSISQRAFKGELDLSKVDISDMDDSKKKETETVKEDTIEENLESLKQKIELLGIVDEKKEDDSYLSKNCQLYIDKSKDLKKRIYFLSKTTEINIADFRNELIELNRIGEELEPEVNEFTAWQIDQHKSVERYISLIPEDVLIEYPNINIFSRNQFDYGSMILDDYYGIPDDVIEQYGSIESQIIDVEFFFKKYFSNKLFTLQEVEELYNKVVYERGDWFEYEEMKGFIFRSMEGENAFLTQTFEEIEILDHKSAKSKTIKKVMLKVIS